LGPEIRCERRGRGEGKEVGGRRRDRLRVESRVHDTNLRSVGEQNRCQVGPTILFECPAQIPRSSLRSFSLWARHSAETSEPCAWVRRNFSLCPAGRCEGGGGGEGRKGGRGGGGGWGGGAGTGDKLGNRGGAG